MIRIGKRSFVSIIVGMVIAGMAGSAGAAPYAYISNYDSNSVSVIDTATNTVTATVPVGSRPIGVAVNLDGTRVYVVNSGNNTVSVIDTATNTVTATVPVGNGPYGVAVNPAGTRVYVTNGNSKSVSVIDTTTNTVIATVFGVASPYGIAVNPAGTRVYVAGMQVVEGGIVNTNTVLVIDTATNTVTAIVPVGDTPYGVAVNPAGTQVYVTNFGGDSVSVIDTATNRVTATVPVGSRPWGVAVNPAGTRVYVTNSGGFISASPMWNFDVSVIDTATNRVIATVLVGDTPFGVAVNPAGTRVYVANYVSNSVSVIDTATNRVTATVSVGSKPYAFGQFIGPYTLNQVATGFKEDFSNPVLNSSWQVLSGQGRYSLTDNPGYLRYYLEGSRGSMGGWRSNYQTAGGWSPSLTMIRPFAGDNWILKTKVNYNLRAHNGGSSTGAQGQNFWIAFGEGTNDSLSIYRGVDWWYKSNVLTMELVSNGLVVANFSGTPSQIGADGWVRESYWYEVTRDGGKISVRFSNDGTKYTTAFSAVLTKPVTTTQRAIIDMNLWNGVGSYVDWDYVYVNSTPTTGSITVATNLAGATFSLTGASSYSGSGKSWGPTTAPAGTYTIKYGTVKGYNAPPSETKTLSKGGSIEFSGTYTLISNGTTECKGLREKFENRLKSFREAEDRLRVAQEQYRLEKDAIPRNEERQAKKEQLWRKFQEVVKEFLNRGIDVLIADIELGKCDAKFTGIGDTLPFDAFSNLDKHKMELENIRTKLQRATEKQDLRKINNDLKEIKEKLKLEKQYFKGIRINNQMDMFFASTDAASVKMNELIKKLNENGKDTSKLSEILLKFDNLRNEEKETHKKTLELLISHPGFDSAGMVTDIRQAEDFTGLIKEQQKGYQRLRSITDELREFFEETQRLQESAVAGGANT